MRASFIVPLLFVFNTCYSQLSASPLQIGFEFYISGNNIPVCSSPNIIIYAVDEFDEVMAIYRGNSDLAILITEKIEQIHVVLSHNSNRISHDFYRISIRIPREKLKSSFDILRVFVDLKNIDEENLVKVTIRNFWGIEFEVLADVSFSTPYYKRILTGRDN